MSSPPLPAPVSTIYELTTVNRLFIADVLEGLSPAQWNAPTLCDGWTVRDLAGHFSQPMIVGFGRFLLTAVRHRGETAATVDDLTRRIARRSPAELVALLRDHADDRIDPPRVGPMGPFTDTCIHLRDMARPLHLDADVPLDQWRLVLEYFVSGRHAEAFVPRGRVDGIRLDATDQPWQDGTGAQLSGPSEALAMALSGRVVALDDLDGPGVDIVRHRLQ